MALMLWEPVGLKVRLNFVLYVYVPAALWRPQLNRRHHAQTQLQQHERHLVNAMLSYKKILHSKN